MPRNIKKNYNTNKKTILVLGAGPAGLACAYQMLSENNMFNIIVLDKAKVPGGAGASFKWNGHTLDYGPHAFHTRGDAPELLIRSLFKEDPNQLITGTKQVRVFLMKRFFKYPLKIKEALVKFNPILTLKILFEFVMTTIIHQIVSIPIESFEDWGRKRFGSTLYRLSFGNYTKKVWKTDPNLISKRFASEKIQGFSFINIIKKLLRVGGQVTEPYYQTWLYPKNGCGVMYMKLADKIQSAGGKIILEAQINNLELKENKIMNIIYTKNNQTFKVEPDFVVNAISLPVFIKLFGSNIPFSVRQNANKLKYISLILVYVEFSIDKIGSDNWFYLLDDEFSSNRVTEQKNLSPFTLEKGKTVLSFELTSRNTDELWNKTDKEIYDIVLQDCKRIPLLASKINYITDYTIRRAPDVYECYYRNFNIYAESVLDYITEDIHNTVTIGRRGMFLQGDMHQSVEMGINMASELTKAISEKSVQSFKEMKNQYIKKYARYFDNS